MAKKRVKSKKVAKPVIKSKTVVRRSKVVLEPRKPRLMGPMGDQLSRDLAKSLANPFEVSACIPDGSRGVGCFSVKISTTLATGTGTCTSAAINLDPRSIAFNDSGSANTTPTISGSWSATNAISTIQANYDAYRPISAGIRITYISNTQTDGGVLLLGQVGGDTPLSTFNGKTLSNASALCSYYKTIPLRNGAELTWRPTEMDDMMAWSATAGSASLVSVGQATPYLICFIYGGNASSTLAQLDYVVNFEGRFSNQTFLPGGIDTVSPHPKAETGWFEKAQNFIRLVEPIVPVATNLFSMANGLRYSSKTADGYRKV